jgi:DegV family protein with EDD domain
MTRVAIITDSTADLASHIAAEAGIAVVPATIRLGVDAIRGTIPAHAGIDAGSVSAASSAPPPAAAAIDAFAGAFSTLAANHDQIVAVLLSSRLGDAVAAAHQARERVRATITVEIVDSRSASLGLGFQALRGVELARQGMDARAIAAALRAASDRYHVVFSVESVEHLRQSGQIGRSAAIISEALQLKPLLRIDEGQIVPYERARTRARAIAELAEFVSALPAVERVAALHAGNREDALLLNELIATDTGLPPARLTVAQIGTAVAAHVGPGALGAAVVEADIR